LPEVTISLKGDEALAYLISKHDWNIFVPDYDRVNVIAYRQERDEDDIIRCDYSSDRSFTLPLNLTNYDSVAILLGEDWTKEVWVDHDDWVGDTNLVTFENDPIYRLYKADHEFRAWFDLNITDYELPRQV